MIYADEHRGTVSSAANKLRDFHSMMNGAMQTQVSAVVKDLQEEVREIRGMRGEIREMREEMTKINAALVLVSKLEPNAPQLERERTPHELTCGFFSVTMGKTWENRMGNPLLSWKHRCINSGREMITEGATLK